MLGQKQTYLQQIKILILNKKACKELQAQQNKVSKLQKIQKMVRKKSTKMKI